MFSRAELEAIGSLRVQHDILILSDEVYDRLYYVPFTRIATLPSEIARRTLTVGSAGENVYATGWRIGWLLGPEYLIKYVSMAHTRICFCSVGPLQEAITVGFERADQMGFWEQSRREMQGKVKRFNEIWHELGLRYPDSQRGYFVLVNMDRVQLPENYHYPPHVASRPGDFQLAWVPDPRVRHGRHSAVGCVSCPLIRSARCQPLLE